MVSFFSDERTRIHVGAAFSVASVPFFLWFFATAASLTPAASRARSAANWGFACGVVTAAVFLCDVAALLVGALRPENMAASPELAQALHDYSWIAPAAVAPVTASIFFAFSVVILRDRALWPRWLGWAAVCAGAAYLLRTGALFTDEGPLAADGILGFIVPVVALLGWTLAASLSLWLRPRADAQ